MGGSRLARPILPHCCSASAPGLKSDRVDGLPPLTVQPTSGLTRRTTARALFGDADEFCERQGLRDANRRVTAKRHPHQRKMERIGYASSEQDSDHLRRRRGHRRGRGPDLRPRRREGLPLGPHAQQGPARGRRDRRGGEPRRPSRSMRWTRRPSKTTSRPSSR